MGALLIANLRSNFAEFLNNSYLARLGLLDLTTCVRSRYGPDMRHWAAFPGTVPAGFVLPSLVSSPRAGHSPGRYPGQTRIGTPIRQGAAAFPIRHCPAKTCPGDGILTICASAAPFGLTLAPG
jgi:hypothetical protein